MLIGHQPKPFLLSVEALTVSFLWSFINPVHEHAAAEALRAEFPDVWSGTGRPAGSPSALG